MAGTTFGIASAATIFSATETGATVAVFILVPQLAQNFADGRLSCWQAGHEQTTVDVAALATGAASDVPHDLQNLSESRFSVPHFEHCIFLAHGEVLRSLVISSSEFILP